MNVAIQNFTQNPPPAGGYRVDVSRGERIGRVSSEWFSRPDDERYLSLTELHEAVRRRADNATARTVESRAVRVEASREDAEKLALVVPGRDEPVAPTHWSFGQLCSLVGAPAAYLRQLPAPLAGINLQHGLLNHRAELVKTLEAADGRVELRAVTGPDYGRIWDHELVSAVRRTIIQGGRECRRGPLDPAPDRHRSSTEHVARARAGAARAAPGRRAAATAAALTTLTSLNQQQTAWPRAKSRWPTSVARLAQPFSDLAQAIPGVAQRTRSQNGPLARLHRPPAPVTRAV